MPLSAQALWALKLAADTSVLVWEAADVRDMNRLYESAQTLARLGGHFPLEAIHLFQPLEKDPAVQAEHLLLFRALEQKGENPLLILTCPKASAQLFRRAETAEDEVFLLREGDEVEMSALMEWMERVGYAFGVEVYVPGEVAKRGGILDCWPAGSPHPVRIEFFGNQIDSIRFFEPQTQCSVERIENIQIPRICWDEEVEKELTLRDLLPEDARWVTPFEDEKEGKMSRIPAGFSHYSTGLFSISPEASPERAEAARRSFLQKRAEEANAGWAIHFFLETPGTRKRIAELYGELPGFSNIHLHTGTIHESAIQVSEKLLLLSESDFYAYQTSRIPSARKIRRFEKQERVSEAADIQPGDFVVHVEHGIGKYLGIVETSFAGRQEEVLCIEYAKGEKLYLPVTQAHLLTRYKSLGKRTPKPHRIHGQKWKNDKSAAEIAIQDLAAKLLQTQAERKALRGHAVAKDGAMQAEFEAAFPYPETPDQLRATEEIKRDLERAQPMDRLLCGDVGFGKTEVAMRAAFKLVMDGRQVAVLVPTTVLAQQHYDTFLERMAPFPVRIGMISRFRTRAQQREVLRKAREGEMDILVGTHRLLSADVAFQNLGLVIIDEEQRFGVGAKERLKELRRQVDVLSMSATPIPRTLYMGLTGVRDLSTIQTPPQQRQPIETILMPYDEERIAQAIRTELQRDGQIFYLHNRVKTIHLVENRLRALVPEARIVSAHGQMDEKELSSLMHAFVQGRFDLLVCTTIIESGVDIPNCNTILIENAERFGLSDLYQLRGRVGRSSPKAFAYLIPSPGQELLESARERLSAIQRHSGLGAGFRLAIRDLELRGAGNLLGMQQSGQISAIGFDLYCQLLRRTIAIMRGKKPPPLLQTTLKLDFILLSPHRPDPEAGAYLPYSYVEDENLRLRLYQRISALGTRKEIARIKKELQDRFGKRPKEVQRLLLIAELRIVAAERGIESITVRQRNALFARLSAPSFRTFLEASRPTAMLKELLSHCRTLPLSR
jgi:transcription-repair coupling factor (superfamily II helicase)